MAKRFKIEDIDAVGIINSMRPVCEPLTEIPSVESLSTTTGANLGGRRTIAEIDEAKCLAYIKENPISKQLEAKRRVEIQTSESSGQTGVQRIASEQTTQSEASTQKDHTESTNQRNPAVQNRTGEKQKREAFEQYRHTFLQVPKIEDRKPVFVSCDTRDRLDEIVRKLGGRKMSVSGLIENLALRHLELYGQDIEQWRKL